MISRTLATEMRKNQEETFGHGFRRGRETRAEQTTRAERARSSFGDTFIKIHQGLDHDGCCRLVDEGQFVVPRSIAHGQ